MVAFRVVLTQSLACLHVPPSNTFARGQHEHAKLSSSTLFVHYNCTLLLLSSTLLPAPQPW
jgi:hypothetical protein